MRPAADRGNAAFARRGAPWPLLATLGLHLLLAWFWWNARPAPHQQAEVRFIDLIPLPAPRAEAPAPPPPSSAATGRPRAAPPAAPPIATPVETPAAVADPFAEVAPAAPAATPAQAIAAQAQRDAGAIDRAQRKGKSGVPQEADTPWARFVRGAEGAYKDSSRTLVSDSYTAPDGEIIYRFRHGGKTWCRISGNVRPDPAGAVGGGAATRDTAGGGGFAGLIRCPSHGDWKRD